jgi:hypothetical protein
MDPGLCQWDRSKVLFGREDQAPYYAEMVRITECPNCNTILWLDQEIKIDSFDDDEFKEEHLWKSEHYLGIGAWADSLEKEGWIRAIQERVFRNPMEEVYLRKKLLWKLNEAWLEKEELWEEGDEVLLQENAKSLIQALDQTSQRDLLLMAELYRNLGDFEAALDALDGVTDPWLLESAYAIFKRCERGEREVFEMK